MIIVPEYRQRRLEIEAVPADGGRFNAVVFIRRVLSDEKPRREVVTCLKLTAMLAEQAGERWAKRWIDAEAFSK